MTYEVAIEASVVRTGTVAIEAASESEARETVARLGRNAVGALPIEWTGSTQPGRVRVLEVREAA